MKEDDSNFKTMLYVLRTWLYQIINTSKLIIGIHGLFDYLKDLKNYSKLEGAEPIKLINTYPCLDDKTRTINFDPHYFYQNVWAFKKIYESKYNYHIDIGSDIKFISLLSVIKKVIFLDIRPLMTKLENFKSTKGNILSLPYKDNSISSLSCLSVAEHIGLGRYGDSLDPLGTKKAAKELSRILAPAGNLYFSVPIGKPRLCFNAHRVHSTNQIFDYFSDLKLVELSGVDDNGNFIKYIEKNVLDSCEYGCGFFWFTKN